MTPRPTTAPRENGAASGGAGRDGGMDRARDAESPSSATRLQRVQSFSTRPKNEKSAGWTYNKVTNPASPPNSEIILDDPIRWRSKDRQYYIGSGVPGSYAKVDLPNCQRFKGAFDLNKILFFDRIFYLNVHS